MNLPHGYEGQGPEHSSARLERFLQLCAEDNMQVFNLTTPAQYYHMLRKQCLQEHKKPGILMSPKSLLRHPRAVSNVDELADGYFRPFLEDERVQDTSAVERVVLCSGKVYYDLLQQAEELDINNVALVRVEQLYPFPDHDIQQYLKSFKAAKDIVWCQEEPKNMGAWFFVSDRIQQILAKGQKIRYAGRQASASPAAGQKKIHDAEQLQLVMQALESVE